MVGENILEIKNLSKYFGSVKALDKIDISIKRGEIYGLVGANGSGKSTLMNILFGNSVIWETGGYEGEIYINDKRADIKSTKAAMLYGIGMIHQEFALIPDMTVAENIKLTRENIKKFLKGKLFEEIGYIDRKKNKADCSEILKKLGIKIEADLPVKRISTNAKQFVEIARELSKDNLKLLFLDEPTAVLNKVDSMKLLSILKELSLKGTSIIFVSHRLEEICEICDRASVLRDGAVVSNYSKAELSIKKLASDMMGCEVVKANSYGNKKREEVLISFEDFGVDMYGEKLEALNLDIYGGEIVGITSLSGHGKLALGYGVMGLYNTSGNIVFEGKKLNNKSVLENIKKGIYFLSEDRKGIGLLHEHSIYENIVFSAFQIKNIFSKGKIKLLSFLDNKSAYEYADKCIKDLDIKCREKNQKVKELSGGNQQKVCIARAFALKPKALFISEPTRGVDIGAKEKLLNIIVEANKRDNMTIIVASSELDELKRICDRIAVLCEGRISKILEPTAADSEFALALSGEEALYEA